MINKKTEDNSDDPNTFISTKASSAVTSHALNDVEYVENYLTDAYAKLADMAQAYSDYGVLDEKKEVKNENPRPEAHSIDHRELDVPRVPRKIFDWFKKGKAKSKTHNVTPVSESDQEFLDKASPLKNNSQKLNSLPQTEYTNSQLKIFPNSNKKENVPAPDQGHKKTNLMSQVLLDKDKRSIKALDVDSVTFNAGDSFNFEFGIDRNSSLIPSKPITVDYNFGTGNTKNIFVQANVLAKFNDTPSDININDIVSFKHRSLKSLDLESIDKVLGIDDHVTFEDMTTQIVTKPASFDEEITVKAVSLKGKDNIIIADATTFKDSRTELNTLAPFISQIKTSNFEAKTENVTYGKIYNTDTTFDKSSTKSNIKNSNVSGVNENLDKNTHNTILNTVNSQNNTKVANDGMDLGDFFKMISTWFSSLSSASLDDNDDQSAAMSPIMKLKTSEMRQHKNANSTDIEFPNYDSDMIENIGHRSRVLMSLDEGNATGGKKETDDPGDEKEQDKLHADPQEDNFTTALALDHDNVLTTTEERDARTPERDSNLKENITVVKRSIGDSGLVFWSDLYDDEYGVKVDPLEKELEEKNGNRGKEFMKRSKIWLQDKVKRIADNIKGITNEPPNSNVQDVFDYHPKYSHVFKRQAKLDKSDLSQEKPSSFAELTVNMRNICKEAAKAVQNTKKMQVRESKEEFVADGLMQQMVRMMSDLVDFQVKQKTCVKLPADLQNFLEWITSPNQDKRSSHQITLQENIINDDQTNDKDKDGSPLMVQDKAECLETLHSVEDLIQRYDLMDDEDKSKMTGVRQYLENQQDFLMKQIALLDEYNFQNMYSNQQPTRFRRHLVSDRSERPEMNRNKIKRSMKRRLEKFIKNFRKHSKSTSNSDSTPVTESSKANLISEKLNKQNVKVPYKDSNKRVQNVGVANDEIKHNNKDAGNDIDAEKMRNDNKDSNKNNDNFIFDKFYGGLIMNNDVSKNNFRVEHLGENLDVADDENRDGYNKNDREERNGKVKRNLQDVYYRALNEAKKVTTLKSIDKNV